jgi:hypothetical protein
MTHSGLSGRTFIGLPLHPSPSVTTGWDDFESIPSLWSTLGIHEEINNI